jgi:hypothetical protein
MAAVFTWTGQRTDASTVTCGATDKFGFYGAAFNTAVEVGAYQDTTHVENTSNEDQCATNHVHNTKYVDSTHVIIDGAASAELAANVPTTAQCPLKLNFTFDTSVTTTACTFWAYDGSTASAVPTGVTFQALEQSDTTWTNAEGSAAAVTITDDTTGTSHDYYIAMSASPESAGAKTAFALEIQLTYQ